MEDSPAVFDAPRRGVTVAALLGSLIVISAVARSIAAWKHSVPRLFPDEYIYVSISRSIGHGHLQIRGEPVHFPAVFEPIVSSPIWRLFSIGTAYHLVQVENAIAASLAAIPVFLLARWLYLRRGYAIGVAIYALLVPELVLIAYTSSDAVGYPLALTAILLAVVSLDSPRPRLQVGFLVFASLATLTRVEYVALVPAYLVAAIAMERRNVWRRHRIALLAAIPVAIIFVVAVFGYYAGERDTALNGAYAKWLFLQMFLLTLATGTLMVPGAVAALTKPRTRRELAFALFAAVLALELIAEATAHSANSSQFKERYVYVLGVLIAIAFGLYIKHDRPRRPVVIGIAAAMIIAAARLPLSEYATASFKMDSQFLFAVSYAQDRFGTSNASLVIALITTLGAIGAIALAFRGGAIIPLALTACFALVVTLTAVHVDLEATQRVRAEQAPNLSWVDQAASGPVDAIETPLALGQDLIYQLYWNPSIKRELLLGAANATDAFSAPPLRIGRDGTLLNASREVLFHDFGTTGRSANATVVKREDGFVLWRGASPIRLRLVVEGRFRDQWLSRSGRLRAWTASGSGVGVGFVLSLPRGRGSQSTVTFGNLTVHLAPGQQVHVSCTSNNSPLDVRYSATPTGVTADSRTVSVQLRNIVVRDQRGARPNNETTCVKTSLQGNAEAAGATRSTAPLGGSPASKG
jgi:dolichyl-phosphate-mannose-protein mannosyltransferase